MLFPTDVKPMLLIDPIVTVHEFLSLSPVFVLKENVYLFPFETTVRIVVPPVHLLSEFLNQLFLSHRLLRIAQESFLGGLG